MGPWGDSNGNRLNAINIYNYIYRICNNLLGAIQSFAASSKSTAEIVRTPFGVCSSIAKEIGPSDTVIPPRPCPQRPDKIYVYFERANE